MSESDWFYVLDRRCDECLFGPNKLVDETTKADVLRRADQDFFVCHKATEVGHNNVCCAGYYTRDPHHSLVMRLAAMLGRVRRVSLTDVRSGRAFPTAADYNRSHE